MPRRAMRPRSIAVVLVAVCASAAAALWVRRAPGAGAPHLNLLVITLDTMRADALGAYGAADGATPNLDRLARSGVVFDDAIAAAPLTLPAHVSLFTAKYPPRHGVRDNGGFVLHPRQRTLAARLAPAGFPPGGVVRPDVLRPPRGLAPRL